MPSFWAMRPVRMTKPPSELDLDIDAGREIELHQRVHGLRRRVDDIEHPLMRADFELFARFLIDVRRAQDREFLDPGRQRNRPAHSCAGPLRGVDDLARRLIEHAMIVSPKADADILVIECHDRIPISMRARAFLHFMILATTPAPTVRPPSRMAKRSPSSMAIG